jgi:hypothetical protein
MNTGYGSTHYPYSSVAQTRKSEVDLLAYCTIRATSDGYKRLGPLVSMLTFKRGVSKT